MRSLDELLDLCVERDASDIHIAAYEPPMLRIYGHITRLDHLGVLTPADTERIVRAITPPHAMRQLEVQMGADFGFSYRDRGRFRVSVFKQKGYYGTVMRLIPQKLLSFEQLGLQETIRTLLDAPRGLILVTGPTGSGKTTTLATCIDYLNQVRPDHIVTIEEPIEYYHRPRRCTITQREVGVDVPDFATGIIKSLRQDPDIILVGEMRDLETIRAAVTAAETGHLVFATLHTTGAVSTVDRIVEVFPTEEQEQIRVMLSGNLNAIISQLLLRRADGKGRTAVFEIMICTPAIRHLIRERRTHSIYSAIQTGVGLGMQTMDMSIINRIKAGMITLEEGLRVAQDPATIREKIEGGGEDELARK